MIFRCSGVGGCNCGGSKYSCLRGRGLLLAASGLGRGHVGIP